MCEACSSSGTQLHQGKADADPQVPPEVTLRATKCQGQGVKPRMATPGGGRSEDTYSGAEQGHRDPEAAFPRPLENARSSGPRGDSALLLLKALPGKM